MSKPGPGTLRRRDSAHSLAPDCDAPVLRAFSLWRRMIEQFPGPNLMKITRTFIVPGT